MPEYEITRADGTISTLAADGLGNAVERAGGHPEPVSVRLTSGKHTGKRTAGQVLAGQPRHASFAIGAATVGQCPVPGCTYISSAHGELQAHGLDEHGFAFGVAKHG